MWAGKNFNFGSWQGEAIEWVCLEDADDGECVLALSTHGLEFGRPFDSRGKPVTWENSEIRRWLNGEFYQNAFTSWEKNKIVRHYSANSVGNDTWDNVFLLSLDEAERYLSPAQCDCYETDHAHKQRMKNLRKFHLENAKGLADEGHLRFMFSSLKDFGKSLLPSERERRRWFTRSVESNGSTVNTINGSSGFGASVSADVDVYLIRPAICFQT